MSIQEVADLLGVSKKKIWKAVTDGDLQAVKVQKGNAWRYQIEPESVDIYRQGMHSSHGWATVTQQARAAMETETQHRETSRNSEERQRNGPETQGNVVGHQPPVELYIEMLDRLQRAERRAIELELQLLQSQRLLTENAESVIEREARAREAEAKESAQRAEAEKATSELAALRTELAMPKKGSGWFSWLGRRKPAKASEQSA